jgi:enamine deaminase RidA (YjgF/YER057c/UK114 family)
VSERLDVVNLLLMISHAAYLLALAAAALLAVSAAPPRPRKQFLNHGEKPPGYTHVVVSPPGKMIFISGQGGIARRRTSGQPARKAVTADHV